MMMHNRYLSLAAYSRTEGSVGSILHVRNCLVRRDLSLAQSRSSEVFDIERLDKYTQIALALLLAFVLVPTSLVKAHHVVCMDVLAYSSAQ